MEANEVIKRLADLEVYFKDDDIRCVWKHMQHIKVATDIGTGWGKAVLAMALSNPEAIVYTYDHGEYPKARGFGVKNYKQELLDRFKHYGAHNIIFQQIDAKLINMKTELLLLDIEDMPYQDKYDLYKRWVPNSKTVLVRNYENKDRDDKEIADELMAGWKKGQHLGVIQPFCEPS